MLVLTVKTPSIKHWVPKLIANPDDLSYYPYMDGKTVFKHAITRFPEVIKEGLQANGLTNEDIDMFIPHQANLRISEFVQHKLRLPDDKVFNNIMRYGNTTSATIAIALTEAVQQGKIHKNDLVVLAAFGAGFTWGSVVMRW